MRFGLRKMGKTSALVILLLLVFIAGFGAGGGQLQIGRQRPIAANSELPADLSYESVEEVYDALKNNFDGDLTTEDLLNGLKSGLTRATEDPYTEYLDTEAAREFSADLEGTFTGVGAELSAGPNKEIVVISPIEGYPAAKAGLRPKDVIIEIDGESAYDITVSEAVQKIRGEKGTKVTLKIVRNGSEALDFEITRETINIPSVKNEIKDGNIGYVQVSRFGDDTTTLIREAATKFKQQNVKGVVLDLRGNPGGLLDQAVDVSSIWLPKGKKILEEKRDDKVIQTFVASGKSLLEGVPTVVLINGGSASASEIVAGALKDNAAAHILGETSYGKGSVQQLVSLGDESVLKVTIARWFTPSGKNIDKEGISPDTEVKRTDDDFTGGRDPQLDASLGRLR